MIGIKKSAIIKFLGIAVSFALIIILFKDIDFREFAETFKNCNKFLILFSGLIYLSNYILRSFRWKFILKSIKDIKTKFILPTILASYSANNLLPLRAGEFIRAIHGEKKTAIPAAQLFSTIIVERIIDVLILLVLLLISLLINPIIADKLSLNNNFAIIVTALLLFIFSMIFAVVFKNKIINLLPKKLQEICNQLIKGLKCINSAKVFLQVIFISVIIWAVEGLTIYLIYLGFNIQTNFMQSLLMLVSINLMITIPSTPGFIGIVESACVLVLSIYGITGDNVLAAAVGLHLVQFIPVTVLGLFILIKDGVSLTNVKSTGDSANLQ